VRLGSFDIGSAAAGQAAADNPNPLTASIMFTNTAWSSSSRAVVPWGEHAGSVPPTAAWAGLPAMSVRCHTDAPPAESPCACDTARNPRQIQRSFWICLRVTVALETPISDDKDQVNNRRGQFSMSPRGPSTS